MFVACYVIQRLDTGEFVGSDEGEMVYYISLSKARLFQSLQNALDYAREQPPSSGCELKRHLVMLKIVLTLQHTLYVPCNYQPALL